VRQDGWLGWLPHEALQVRGIGSQKHPLPGVTHRFGPPVVYGDRRHQSDSCVAMLAVVPGEERLAESAGVLEATEAIRKVRAVLQRVELGLGERVIVAGIGPAVCVGAPQVGKQPRHRFGWHGEVSIRMQGQLPRLDLLLRAGVNDEPLDVAGSFQTMQRSCRGT